VTAEDFKKLFPNWEHLTFEYGRWTSTHKDYDASYEGEEIGWVDNGLKAEGRTITELAVECKEIEEGITA